MKSYYIYIMASKKNGTLYIGVTNDLARRVSEHKSSTVEGFTKKYVVNRLVYFEVYKDINTAIQRETQLKGWKRTWKIDLIEKDNIGWKDLFEEWGNV